jgi:hypothetical protein
VLGVQPGRGVLTCAADRHPMMAVASPGIVAHAVAAADGKTTHSTGPPAMALTQSEAYFKIADADKDGMVGGGEAVQFFLKSGLHQETLGQVRSTEPGWPGCGRACPAHALRLTQGMECSRPPNRGVTPA